MDDLGQAHGNHYRRWRNVPVPTGDWPTVYTGNKNEDKTYSSSPVRYVEPAMSVRPRQLDNGEWESQERSSRGR